MIYRSKNKFKFITLFLISLTLTSCGGNQPSTKMTLTYSLYPYFQDETHYRNVIENEWKQYKPDVELKFVEYNCYHDGEPKDIDVIMIDSTLENSFIEKNYIQSIPIDDIKNKDDYFEYSINDIYKDNKLYGLPSVICQVLLIYDETNEVADKAACIDDLKSLSTKLVANVDYNYKYFYNDYLIDKSETYIQYMKDPDEEKQELQYFRNICNSKYLDSDSYTLAEPYYNHECDAYYSYTETLAAVGDRISTTKFKPLSMVKDKKDIPLIFEDMLCLNSNVDETKRSNCIDLMNFISSVDISKKAAIKDNTPSYVIYPRKSFYDEVGDQFPIYKKLYEIVSDSSNHIFR